MQHPIYCLQQKAMCLLLTLNYSENRDGKMATDATQKAPM